MAQLMLCKRPGEMAINALVGAQIIDNIIRDIRKSNSDVEVSPEVRVHYESFKATLLKIAFRVLERASAVDSEMTVHALQSRWPNSGGIEAWLLAYTVQATEITAMPAHRLVVDAEWWGSVAPDNGSLKILLSILTCCLYLLFWSPYDMQDAKNGRPAMFRNGWYLPMRITTARGNGGAFEGNFEHGSGTSNVATLPGDGTFKNYRNRVSRRLHRFLVSPQIGFYFSCLFYFLYVTFFSYSTLLAPQPWKHIFEEASTGQIDLETFAHIFSLVLLISNILEEVMELCGHIKDWSVEGMRHGVAVWWSSYWNKWDVFMYSIIVTGVVLKAYDDIVILQWSKILLALGALLLWLRSMRFFAKFPLLGPKTIMVFNMLDDFIVFAALVSTGLIGSGVAMYSVAQPWRGIDEGTAIDIFYKPTFQMFGELFLEETALETGCDAGDGPGWRSCQANWYVAMVLLVAYVLYSNVLLVNMLIAMMSATYDAIEENSYEFWSIQNIELLHEVQRTEYPEPPPLNLIAYTMRGLHWLGERLLGRTKTSRKVHPLKSSEREPRIERRRRDLESLDDVIAFLKPHGAATVQELALLDPSTTL